MSVETVRIDWSLLKDFIANLFVAKGISKEDANIVSDVLITADARGIKSHGVARTHVYLKGIEEDNIHKETSFITLFDTPSTISIDANGSLGQPISVMLMNKAIEKAKKCGIGVAVCRNSNHFGIAGYYSEMAARENMIGISLTNTAALAVPTFGKEAMFGTNPIAFAVPGLGSDMYSLDMATTVVPRGKIEVYQRAGKEIPSGWAVGIDGLTTNDPTSLLLDMVAQKGGGLMPLGGEGELFSGYKGYGLAVLVDILTGVLSGGKFGRDVKDQAVSNARVCHFFLAIDISRLREIDDFKKDISTMLDRLVNMPKAEGQNRVYYAGLKEQENEQSSKNIGIPIEKKVWDSLCEIANTINVDIPIINNRSEL